MKTMLKEIKGLDEVIQHAVFFADWVWNSYDKPGFEKDYNMEEARRRRDEDSVLKENGVENAVWSLSKDCGNRTYTTLLVRFSSLTEMAAELLRLDMANKLLPFDQATGNGEGEDEYLGQFDGDDIYICPFGLTYEDGWLTLELKIFRE